MKIVKVFNNNVVLVEDDDGREIVVRGRGVGFQRSTGDQVPSELIEQQYVPSGATPVERVVQLVLEIRPEILVAAESILERARSELASNVSEHALLPLADHLSFAISRVERGDVSEYPLRWEVATLDPREVAFARVALDDVFRELGTRLPASEAVPLALHLVNGQFADGSMALASKVTDALAASVRIVAQRWTNAVDMEGMDVSRFVTHVRYLIARCMDHTATPPLDEAVAAALRTANAAEYEVAVEIATMLESEFEFAVGEPELLYLTVHVARVAHAKG